MEKGRKYKYSIVMYEILKFQSRISIYKFKFCSLTKKRYIDTLYQSLENSLFRILSLRNSFQYLNTCRMFANIAYQLGHKENLHKATHTDLFCE